MIVSYAPGYSVYCPKCNDDKVVIFFDPKFVGRYRSVWIGLINERKIVLENKWDKIKVENQWIDINPKDAVPNWVCKNCYDGGIIVEYPINEKIADEFKKYEKTFTEKSEPLYWNEYAQKVTLKEIHDNADIGEKSLVLIAVTREQYNTNNFSKYREYIKNTLNKDTIYYGLWPDTQNSEIEYDILYTIDSTNKDEIQKHLNLHNEINNGLAQKMALIIDKDGNWEVQNNEKL
jgi:hypothetical protein